MAKGAVNPLWDPAFLGCGFQNVFWAFRMLSGLSGGVGALTEVVGGFQDVVGAFSCHFYYAPAPPRAGPWPPPFREIQHLEKSSFFLLLPGMDRKTGRPSYFQYPDFQNMKCFWGNGC